MVIVIQRNERKVEIYFGHLLVRAKGDGEGFLKYLLSFFISWTHKEVSVQRLKMAFVCLQR